MSAPVCRAPWPWGTGSASSAQPTPTAADREAGRTENFVALGKTLLERYPDLTIGITGAPSERADAEASFQKALRLDPTGSELANNYGWFLCQTGRERESLQYFDRAFRKMVEAFEKRADELYGRENAAANL